MPEIKKRPKIFYGWWVVAASAAIMFYVAGIINQGFTAVFQPIVDEFGWTYTQVSGGAMLRSLEVGLLAPLVGYLVDRWGSRKLVLGGVILVSLGLFSLSRINSLTTFYLSVILVAIGMSSCVGTAFLPTVTNWFRKRVGTAMGLAAVGGGLGGLTVPIVTLLVDNFGWRDALFYLSISVLVVGLPLAMLLRHKPEQYGYLPDGEVLGIGNKSVFTPVSSLPVITAGQVLKTRIFWQLSIASICFTGVTGAIMTHIMPYLSSVGISRTFSSILVLMLSVVNVMGRFGSGWLADKFSTQRVYVVVLILMSMGTLAFAYIVPGSILLIVIFVIFYGLGQAGSQTLRTVILRKYFSSGKFGTILGVADMMMMLGQFGVLIAGWAFDVWDTYRGIWIIYAGLILVGIALIATTPKTVKIKEPESPAMTQ